ALPLSSKPASNFSFILDKFFVETTSIKLPPKNLISKICRLSLLAIILSSKIISELNSNF
ncbi:hypothetical protein, partial [Clostridioides difficile]|uniref:hypothetical protein n=1 Tax=Clostridioides difficile TaxID=1496 RepID=UPI001A9A6426